MTNDELMQLKALAEAATPGPWYGFFDGVRLAPEVFGQKNISRYVCGVMGTTGNNTTEHYNSNYIAAANPAVILALIAKIESIAADAKRYHDLCRLADRYHFDLSASQESINEQVADAVAKEKA